MNLVCHKHFCKVESRCVARAHSVWMCKPCFLQTRQVKWLLWVLPHSELPWDSQTLRAHYIGMQGMQRCTPTCLNALLISLTLAV